MNRLERKAALAVAAATAGVIVSGVALIKKHTAYLTRKAAATFDPDEKEDWFDEAEAAAEETGAAEEEAETAAEETRAAEEEAEAKAEETGAGKTVSEDAAEEADKAEDEPAEVQEEEES